MVKLSYLFSQHEVPKELSDNAEALQNSIDQAISKGDTDPSVLGVMKDLLDDLHLETSITSYVKGVKRHG